MSGYVCCTFEYSEDGPGAYTIMAVRIMDPDELLRQAGWRHGHTIFMVIDGGVRYPTQDINVLDNQLSAHDDGALLALLRHIRDGALHFEDVDGRTFHQAEDPDSYYTEERLA